MKRRSFVIGGSGLIVGEALASQSANGQPGSSSAHRWTRVAPEGSIVQDIVVEHGFVYSLVHSSTGDSTNKAHRQWMVTQTTLDGQMVWEHSLSRGVYVGLGLDRGTVWVHAPNYYDRDGTGRPHSILRIADGRTEVVTSLGMSANGRFRYAGPSSLVNVRGNWVDLWRLDEYGLSNRGIGLELPFKLTGFIDLLSPGIASITATDGSQITTVEIASGVFRDVPISLSVIASAQAYYAQRAGNGRGRPVVIPATGADGNGLLYAVVMPSQRTAVRVVKIDAQGMSAGSLALQFPPRQGRTMTPLPLRLIVNGAELGVVYADGAIGWYPV